MLKLVKKLISKKRKKKKNIGTAHGLATVVDGKVMNGEFSVCVTDRSPSTAKNDSEFTFGKKCLGKFY